MTDVTEKIISQALDAITFNGNGLVAAIAGLTNDAEPATVATAMTWVFRVNVGIAVLALLVAIPMIARGRARMEAAAAKSGS